MRYLRIAISFLIACALSACDDGAGAGAPSSTPLKLAGNGTYPSVRYTDCPSEIEQYSSGMRCGFLDTYQNYAETGPDAKIIEIAFGILPATTTPVEPDPIVVFFGGPGASALSDYARNGAIESYTPNRDFILVDQRGTGLSKPYLRCENGTQDRSCIDVFTRHGVDLTQYRSAVIAQDYKVLREALEIDQWNVYGESYGPTPGILYADLDPEGVRSVTFDSNSGNQANPALADAAVFLNIISELAEQCAAEPVCAARIPDVRSLYIDTFRSLENEPWNVTIPGENTNGELLFFILGYVKKTQYPAVLELIANRDSETLLQLISSNSITNNNAAQPLRKGANLMGAVVQCAHFNIDNYYTSSLPTVDQWPDDLTDAVRKFVGYVPFCASGVVPIEQDLSQREPRLLDVPALIVGGALDRLVSVSLIRKSVESFESPLLAIAPKGGHGVGFPTSNSDPCMRGIIASFIDNPAVAPPMDCLTENVEPFVFDEELASEP